MKSQTHLHPLHAERSIGSPLHALSQLVRSHFIRLHFLRGRVSTKSPARPGSLGQALIVLTLLFLGHGALLAQQPFPTGQGQAQDLQPNDPNAAQYGPQYSPDRQPGYGQPPYPQQQPYSQQPYADPNQQFSQQSYVPAQTPAQPLNTEQLEQLVAPIALYPDTLVAQILAAATYPDQVVDADHWRHAQSYASPDQVADGADTQSWDPSLKALTAFPQILAELDQNLRWTIALGNAYYNQPQDVLDVIQVMRQRAEGAGNLRGTPQESLSYDQGYIQLAPVNPQVVYLPVYDPWTAYGQPIQPYRGFSVTGALGNFFGSSFGSGAIRYGLGIAMSAFSHTSFGWLGWGLNWLSHSVLFHNSTYATHSTSVADWGLPQGGPRSAMQRGALAARLPNNAYGSQDRIRGRDQSWSQPRNYPRTALDNRAYGANNGYDRTTQAQGFVRPSNEYAGNNGYQGTVRTYPTPATGYARPPAEAYNRVQLQPGRPQILNRPGYGPGYNSAFDRPSPSRYAARPAPAYNPPQQAYRAPSPSFQRGDFGERYSGSVSRSGSEGYSGKSERSGGFRPFGGGKEHEPKAPKEPKHYKESSHGHSDRGGHSGGRSGGLFGGSHRR